MEKRAAAARWCALYFHMLRFGVLCSSLAVAVLARLWGRGD